MKRALALLAACSLFGFVGLAQITGSWETTLTFDLYSCVNDLIDIDSAFELDYVAGGMTFGMEAGFDDVVGFKSFAFTAEGALGPLSLSSTMSFLPAAVTSYDYDYTGAQVTDATVGEVTIPAYKTYDSVTVTKTYAAAFDEWTVEASLEFGGITFGGFFFLEGYDGAYTTNDIWDFNGTTAVQTGSHAIADTSCLTTKGSGWKFTVSGSVNGVTVTSYTYFNLYEYDAYWSTNVKYGLNLGKRGIYKIPSSGCNLGFSEEYLMIEGLSLCCGTTVDAALKVTCSGFSYLRFLVKDIPFPCCGIDMDLGVSFGLTSKSVAWVFDIGDLEDCLALDLEVVSSGSAISDLRIKKISVDCDFAECLSFSAATVLYKDSAGTFSLKTIEECDKMHFFVPATCFDATEAVEASDGVGIYTETDVVKYKWLAWESFGVEICGPGCCGGEFTVTVNTYFGNRYGLESWGYIYKDGEGDTLTYTWKKSDTSTAPTITAPTTNNTVATGAVYTELASTSLFNWMATEASFSIPVMSNFTVDIGALVSVLGFQSLDFGFTFTF